MTDILAVQSEMSDKKAGSFLMKFRILRDGKNLPAVWLTLKKHTFITGINAKMIYEDSRRQKNWLFV